MRAAAVAAAVGLASWYGPGQHHATAICEPFHPRTDISAASPTMPLPYVARVIDVATGRSLVVRVNDRGPARWTHHIMDLSEGAARRLGVLDRGVFSLRVIPLGPAPKSALAICHPRRHDR